MKECFVLAIVYRLTWFDERRISVIYYIILSFNQINRKILRSKNILYWLAWIELLLRQLTFFARTLIYCEQSLYTNDMSFWLYLDEDDIYFKIFAQKTDFDKFFARFLQFVVQVYYPFEVKIWILSCGWWIICPFVNFLKRNIHIFASIINQQTTHHGEIYVKERFGWSIAVLTENRILKS